MKLSWEPVNKWFGFNRRERRSAFILLIIIIMIVAFRYTVPERNIFPEDLTSLVLAVGSQDSILSADSFSAGKPFLFDPNISSYDTLIKLGFTAKEANTLISYRNKGGKFREPVDIKKVYGIEEEKAERLIPFIEVAPGSIEQDRIKPFQKQKHLIEINSSDSALLVTLPGIGPVLSARIIKYRHLLGGFARIDQLKEVYGLSEETYSIIKGRLSVDTSSVSRINVNSADYKELARFPYFEKYEVTAILKYRELKGKVNGIADLVDNNLITKEKASKAGPYLRFE